MYNASQRACYRVALAAACMVSFPQLAEAQFDKFVAAIHEVSFSVSCWNTRGPIKRTAGCFGGFRGFGVEVMYRLEPIELVNQPKQSPSQSDSTAPKQRPSQPDTMAIVGPYIQLELALGYSQFSGFESEDTNIELRGSVREFPSASLYATLQTDSAGNALERLQPYIGLRSGFIKLETLQLYDALQPAAAATYSGGGEAFQVGAVAGISVSFGPVTPFLEIAQTYRKIPSIKWSMVNNQVHPAAPRVLDFSGRSYSAGIQVSVQ